MHLFRSWPHSPLTYQRTFSGVVHEIEVYCLGLLLVIRFQISNNTELIPRGKVRTLNPFRCMYSHAETGKGCQLFLAHLHPFYHHNFDIPCSFILVFFSDYRGNICSLWEIGNIPPSIKKIKISWISPQSYCLKPHFQALSQSVAGPKGTVDKVCEWMPTGPRYHF